jgi:hypothetical protein
MNNTVKKYKTENTPYNHYLVIDYNIPSTSIEVYCKGYLKGGKTELSLNGYYFKNDLNPF